MAKKEDNALRKKLLILIICRMNLTNDAKHDNMLYNFLFLLK